MTPDNEMHTSSNGHAQRVNHGQDNNLHISKKVAFTEVGKLLELRNVTPEQIRALTLDQILEGKPEKEVKTLKSIIMTMAKHNVHPYSIGKFIGQPHHIVIEFLKHSRNIIKGAE